MLVCNRRHETSNSYCIHYIPGNPNDNIGFCSFSNFRCEEREAELLPYISNSQLTFWDTCRRKYFLRYICGVIRHPYKMPAPVKAGKLWDIAMGVRYKQIPASTINETIEEYEIDPFDVAKVKALFKAHRKIFGEVDTFNIEYQKEISRIISNENKEKIVAKGITDFSFSHHFIEMKLTGRPQYYDNVYSMTPQSAMYFLLNPDFEYCIVKIVRIPDKRKSYKTPEDPDLFERQILTDILSRPSHYFIGYKREINDYGIKFYRDDFPLNAIKEKLIKVHMDIQQGEAEDNVHHFYEQRTGCMSYGQRCEYMEICETQQGQASELLYTIDEVTQRVNAGEFKDFTLLQLGDK